MNKKIILAVIIIVLGLGAGGYYYWDKYISKTPEEKAAESLEKALESAGSAVLPEITTATDPLKGGIQELNPVTKINPFKDVYENPFE